MSGGFIPPHGGYQKLLSYQKAEIVYDATVSFCDRFIGRRSRTHDQMIQAARSGKQNIVEGSMASGTSKETEIKLTNVARASLEELLADYRDFLRVRKLLIWDKDDPKAQAVRKLGYGTEGTHGMHRTHRTHGTCATYATYASHVEQSDPETAANAIICLIHQANYLLDQQLRALEAAFVKEGGLRERMTRARLEQRKKKTMP
ncbi:MAG: four helix bundle protein [Zetaproteobacteria bacterium]|nr:MAG: four helix bundle protein [Zetaproteobacteria bacterium]